MGKTLVTGGSGFIGSHLVRDLARRGDDLRLLVRRSSQLDHLDDVEFEKVVGDVTDRRAVRRAVEGAERVFHVAGSTSMRRADRGRVFDVNVGGTRNVMEEALEAGVERMVHTSTVGAIGPAKPGGTADERQLFRAGGLGISYINSKHEAEIEALRLAAHGLPVVIVNPAFVLGPDDPAGTSNALVRRFLLRQIPGYVDGGLNIVDVRDVARGHLQADRKGRVGERYILGGRNFTLARLFADLARISGVDPPPLKLPGRLALAWIEAAERSPIPAPVSSDELKSGMQWWTYRSTKAKKELGFSPRPHEETLEDTVKWQLEHLEAPAGGRAADLTLRLIGRAARIGERLGR